MFNIKMAKDVCKEIEKQNNFRHTLNWVAGIAAVTSSEEVERERERVIEKGVNVVNIKTRGLAG